MPHSWHRGEIIESIKSPMIPMRKKGFYLDAASFAQRGDHGECKITYDIYSEKKDFILDAA